VIFGLTVLDPSSGRPESTGVKWAVPDLQPHSCGILASHFSSGGMNMRHPGALAPFSLNVFQTSSKTVSTHKLADLPSTILAGACYNSHLHQRSPSGTMRACSNCQKSKLRCVWQEADASTGLPACTRCRRQDLRCWVIEPVKRGPRPGRRVTKASVTQHDVPLAITLTLCRDRVNQLEQKLNSLASLLAASHHGGQTIVPDAVPAQARSPNTVASIRGSHCPPQHLAVKAHRLHASNCYLRRC
jgi:hypothetical protein